MMSRASNQQKVFSRNMIHGNRMNKRGVAQHFQNGIRSERKVNFHPKKYHQVNPVLNSQHRDFGDMVVRGPPPKMMVQYSTETRFTIPTTFSNNNNIYSQVLSRSNAHMNDVLHELRSYYKIHAFNVDQDHDIQVVMV
jgi:hypothetical protein